MECELDIIDSLNALAYEGRCLQNDVLTQALEGGLRSKDFREVVGWLSQELHVLRKTDERIGADLNDTSEFAMELSAMLKELGCPFTQFVTGPLSERFGSHASRMQLLEYLITELMATKMSLRMRPTQGTYVIPKFETNTARTLEQLTRDLCLGKPPENITSRAMFDKINFKVEELLRQVDEGVLSNPLLLPQKPLTDVQWKQLENVHADLDSEYNLRRQVLLTRLEVTIQSFQWSQKMRAQENEIVSRFQKKMQELDALTHGGTDTNIVALLAARCDLAIIEKTSSANVRKNTGSKIQKHVIGSVPDRGGRAHEHAPPPPEMPSWQQQRAVGPAGGRGGNFRGGRAVGGGNYSGSYQQRSQQYEQRPQFEQGRDQNWVSGSGRVQGSGWSQKSNECDQRGGSSNYHGDGAVRGNDNNYRGRFNHNRGGGGGGYRR